MRISRRHVLGPALAMVLMCTLALQGQTPLSAGEGVLTFQKETGLTWSAKAGRAVRIQRPQLTLEDPKDNKPLPFKAQLTKHSIQKSEAVMEYALSLDEKGIRADGTATVKASLSPGRQDDALTVHMDIAFREPVKANVEVRCLFDVQGEGAGELTLPRRDGRLTVAPLAPNVGGGGKFESGQAGRGACPALGMPVIGLGFGGRGTDAPGPAGGSGALQLAVSADPYCGSSIQAAGVTEGRLPITRVAISTSYTGSVVPIRSEGRTMAMEFHRQGRDGTLQSFYRTIPEIKPGAPWTRGVHLVEYDYLSEKSQGWFKDLQALADRIPREDRGHVAVCMHGWYDYFQQYAYDHKNHRLLKEWTAFPGTHKVPMTLAEMHKRLRFAKDLGFRVLLYFADGTNSDSGAPAFHSEYVLKGKDGNTFPGWKGPDSLGQPLMMDPSVVALRDWYRGYLKALLEEYVQDVDGFVWDETFYIQTNFISYTQPEPAYADRAMMSLVSELTQMVQSYHGRNPDLVFLASDLGQTNYALVAHGTYQDSAMDEGAWGPSLFANYRNCLWSCNWSPLGNAKRNEIAAEKYGLPQGVSNGWGDNCGPSRMPPALLEEVLKRFAKNVKSNRQRIRYLEADGR